MEQSNKEARTAILKQMNITEDVITFLESIDVPLLREWSYLCCAEGMTKQSIESLCRQAKNNKTGASETFLKERKKHLRLQYENNNELKDRFEKLRREIEAMYKRASGVETALDETIKKTLRDKDELFGKLIEEKDAAIRDRDRQIESLHERIRYMEEQRKQEITPEVIPEAKEETNEKGDDIHEQKTPAPSPLPLPARLSFPVHRENRSFSFHRRDRTAEKFIREFMENDKYSEEQKDFLIRCLEQGDTVEFMKKYARPNLSIERMLWIRDLVGRRMFYGS